MNVEPNAAEGAGEAVLYQGRLHWTIFVRPVMLACLALLLLTSDNLIVGIIVLPIALAFWVMALTANSNSAQLITAERVRLSHGRIYRHRVEIPLAQIDRVKLKQDTMGRMLGYGTLIVESSRGDHASCANLSDPSEFQRQLEVAAGLAE
ncbi:MAG: PH domain-containing protein [Candidatus Viridilinea halotolerans]|uniref:PH domain-containing protein n=1 Tax=Candidatus Viridilinea halotolerans TaxID=2491704 RepID=A0A426U707_9CHLR|nr:MAG: PH domain-containing protein [Candidatus Viridilinea halotolerans]